MGISQTKAARNPTAEIFPGGFRAADALFPDQ
jgi:hypothetical protein